MHCASQSYHRDLKRACEEKAKRNFGGCSSVFEVGHLGYPLSDMSRLLTCYSDLLIHAVRTVQLTGFPSLDSSHSRL